MEQYYEQHVLIKGYGAVAKKTKIFTMIKLMCIVMFFMTETTALLFVGDLSVGALVGIMVGSGIPFIGGAVALGIINRRNNIEYDYVIDDECIKISAIYYREKRVGKYKITFTDIDSIGVFGSDGFLRAAQKAKRKLVAILNYENEKNIVYILYNTQYGKQIVYIEPDHSFLMALRRAVPMSIFDRSIRELEKLLNEQRAEEYALEQVSPDRDENDDATSGNAEGTAPDQPDGDIVEFGAPDGEEGDSKEGELAEGGKEE